jgi:hypothetical protein
MQALMTSPTEPKDPEVSANRCRAGHGQPTELRTSVTIHRKLFGALAVVVVALPLTAATQIPASASTVASASSLAKDLLPSSYANEVGFTKVVENVTTSKTGNRSCPLDAQEVFENAQGTLDLISGAATCTTSQGALRSARSGTLATSASPPKQLGSSAIERRSPGSVYEIYWLRGLTLEVVEIAAGPPSSPRPRRPITSAQQKILSSAAVEQNRLLG